MRFRMAIGLSLALLACPATAQATFPGANGKFVFAMNPDGTQSYPQSIYLMNPDGTNVTRLTFNSTREDSQPKWSPSGAKIAFASDRDGNNEIYVMNVDGTGQSRLTQHSARDSSPSWSPDGTKIAFTSHRDGNAEIYLMGADGSNPTRLTFDEDPDVFYDDDAPAWSPDGQRIAFSSLCWFDEFTCSDREIRVINMDGSPAQGGGYAGWAPNWSPDGLHIAYEHGPLTSTSDIGIDGQPVALEGRQFGPAWSPDGEKIAFYSTGQNQAGPGTYTMNPDGTGVSKLNDVIRPLDWQPLRPPGFARPTGASPVNVRLVPAFRTCTNSNASHGAPFNVSSCSPPTEESTYATTGHGDAGRMAGLVTFRVVGESPVNPNNGDQADVQLTASITDVRNPDLSDYTGELRVSPVFRITDRQSGGTYSPPIHPATASDTPFGFTLTCATTTETNIGSTCSATTTADAVMPGIVKEGKRSVWQMGQVRVFDGGADGDADTAGDNTLFLTQGLFAP